MIFKESFLFKQVNTNTKISKKVLVIGDAILDHYLFGAINRQSPEDKNIPVFDIKKEEYRLGGCLNVAANIRSLSKSLIDPYVASVFSRYTGKKMYDKGIRCDDSCITTENVDGSNSPSPSELIKTRVVNQDTNKQLIRIDNHLKFKSEDVEFFKSSFEYNLEDFDAIVISDYQKGLIDNFIVDKLKEYKGHIFVDTKNPDFHRWSDLNEKIIFKLNNEEWFNVKFPTKPFVTVVTQGANGAVLFSGNIFVGQFKVEPVKDADVVGAGDIFLSGLVVKYIQLEKKNKHKHKNLIQAIKFANKYARKSVCFPGTTEVYPDDY